MPRKILVVSMGRGGNAVATAFFEKLLTECGVGPNGEPPADAALADALTVFCDRTGDGRLMPRRLMAATSESYFPAPESPYGSLYPAEAKILETGDHSDNNWAKGCQAPTVETLVALVEQRLQALGGEGIIWLFHALGGGYGAGAGSQFLEWAANQFQESVALVSIPILPSARVSDTVVEPYNAVLSMPSLVERAHLMLVLDNGALHKAVQTKIRTLRYTDLDALAVTALSTLVSPMLWPDAAGQRLTADEFHAHLWNPTGAAVYDVYGAQRAWSGPISPSTVGERLISLSHWEDAASPQESLADVAQRVVAAPHGLLSAETAGEWLSVLVVVNGSHADAADLGQVVGNGSARLAINPRTDRTRAIAAGRNTGLIEAFKRVFEGFIGLYRRKAFLHWYTAQGIDELQFTESSAALDDVIMALQMLVPQQAEEYPDEASLE